MTSSWQGTKVREQKHPLAVGLTTNAGKYLLNLWFLLLRRIDNFPNLPYLSFPNVNGCTVEVWERISNLIPHFIMGVITYTCWQCGSRNMTSSTQSARIKSSSHPLRWRHNGLDSVSNHQPHDCLLNRSFGCRSKKTSNLRVTGLCVGNSPVTGEFPAQMASNAENVSIWWRHHAGRDWVHRRMMRPAGKIRAKIIPMLHMMTSSNENMFRVTGPWWGNPPVTGGFLLTKASYVGLWCFLWSDPEQTVEQTIETLVI